MLSWRNLSFGVEGHAHFAVFPAPAIHKGFNEYTKQDRWLVGGVHGYELQQPRGYDRLVSSLLMPCFHPQGQPRYWPHKGGAAPVSCIPPTCLRRYADQHRPLLHGPLEAAKAEKECLRSDMASANIATAYIPKAPNHVGAPRLIHILPRRRGGGSPRTRGGRGNRGGGIGRTPGYSTRSKVLNMFLVCETRQHLAELPGPPSNLATAPRAQRPSPKSLHATVATWSRRMIGLSVT